MNKALGHNDLPTICGSEEAVAKPISAGAEYALASKGRASDFTRIRSGFAVALHMHQPLIPAGSSDLKTAEIVSNLDYMMRHQDTGDNHNAPAFHWCYKRMGEFIPALIDEGKQPRVMLDYSGALLHGLWKMGMHDVFDGLWRITCEPRYAQAVEWLGSAWGHPVAPSTPPQDYRLHVRAWQHHFARTFGCEALGRVRGFSPAEMALPNHPDAAYEFVRTLKDCGYRWLLVQEHTVERPETGTGPEQKHLPHRLVCRNSLGEKVTIIALVKTQGSDTKLVAQMQPYYEAKGLSPWDLAGKRVPPLVVQIADGENGGVMMNEFPGKYHEAVRECSGSETPILNGSEYLELLAGLGIRETDLPPLQPILQKRVWDRFRPGSGPERLAKVIDDLKREDSQFHTEGGSWTNNLSWVRGYERLLNPIQRASTLFFKKVIRPGVLPSEPRYRNALFHLLCSQTSCFRCWGEGLWAEYGREICRRLEAILRYDF